MKKTFRLVYISLLASQALTLFIVESMIPPLFITPGAKIGLTNLITVIGLYTLDKKKDVFLIILIRLLLSTMFNGSLSTFIYSSSGALASFIMMISLKVIFKDKLSIIGISVVGAFFHNFTQLVVASLIINNIGLMLYLPMLSGIGIGTGIFIGLTATFIVKHISKLPYFKNLKEA